MVESIFKWHVYLEKGASSFWQRGHRYRWLAVWSSSQGVCRQHVYACLPCCRHRLLSWFALRESQPLGRGSLPGRQRCVSLPGVLAELVSARGLAPLPLDPNQTCSHRSNSSWPYIECWLFAQHITFLSFFLFSFFKDFIYLFMRDTEGGRDLGRERNGLLAESQMWDLILRPGITPWAEGRHSIAEPPRHPTINSSEYDSLDID